MSEHIWILTDTAVYLSGLRNAVTKGYINDAIITATLYTEAGVAVAGAIDLPLSFIVYSDGCYVGEVPSTVTLVEDGNYYVMATITGDGWKTTMKLERTARYLKD